MGLPDFSYETVCWQNGHRIVAGLDEVGRGSFAGPVITGAVVFSQLVDLQIPINDSKKLSPKQREVMDLWIRENALAVGIGSASVGEINRLGIKKATDVAFRRAIAIASKKLDVGSKKADNEIRKPKSEVGAINLQSSTISVHGRSSNFSHQSSIDYLLIDAFHIPRVRGLGINRQKAIIKGDSLSVSIAAASIVAKVYRDELMISLGRNSKYIKYGWHGNKGYGTADHRGAILKHGSTRLHRKQFVETWLQSL